MKDAEKKWKGASKSEMKKIYAQVKEQAIQDGLNKDKEFAELQGKIAIHNSILIYI